MPKKDPKSILNTLIEVSILVTLFCLPFSKSLVEICVTIAIITFFVKKIFFDKSFALKIDKRILIALFLFAFASLLSIINSQYPAESVRALFSKVLEWVLFFIIVADTIKTRAQARRVFVTMLASAALILADAVYQQYITGVDFLHYPKPYPVFKFHSRPLGKLTFPTACFPYPNDFAAWINIFLFTFLGLAVFDLRKRKNYRILTYALSAGLVFFLFRTASRAAIAGFVPSVMFLVMLVFKKFIVPITALFIVIVIAVSFIPYMRDEIFNIRQSFDDRMSMWETGWRIFKEHPIMGNGINTFFANFTKFRQDDHQGKSGSYAHNCFLQMAADIGILGLGAFLFFVIVTLYSNIRKTFQNPHAFKNAYTFGLSLGVIAFLIHSFFDTNLYSLNLAALFWLSMGLIEGIGSNSDEAG